MILLMATVLNPSKRLKFFENYYPDEVPRIRTILDEAFQNKVVSSETEEPISQCSATQSSLKENQHSEEQEEENLFGPSEVTETTNRSEELEIYLGAKHPYKDGCILKWWQVRDSQTFLNCHLGLCVDLMWQ